MITRLVALRLQSELEFVELNSKLALCRYLENWPKPHVTGFTKRIYGRLAEFSSILGLIQARGFMLGVRR